MGFYDGFQFFRKNGLQIRCEVNLIPKARTSIVNDNFLVEISPRLSLDERVKSIIHEAIHFGSPHLHRLIELRNKGMPEKEYQELETDVENLTEQVYKNQPVLVRWLKTSLTN